MDTRKDVFRCVLVACSLVGTVATAASPSPPPLRPDWRILWTDQQTNPGPSGNQGSWKTNRKCDSSAISSTNVGTASGQAGACKDWCDETAYGLDYRLGFCCNYNSDNGSCKLGEDGEIGYYTHTSAWRAIHAYYRAPPPSPPEPPASPPSAAPSSPPSAVPSSPPSASPSSPPSASSSGDPSTGDTSTNSGSTLTGDPHLHFAHGGSADFRGKNDTDYALLSAPGMQVSGKTIDADFLLPHPQLVHGSFFVHAEWMVRGTSGRVYAIESDSNEVGFTVSEKTAKGFSLVKKLTKLPGQSKEWAADGIIAMYSRYGPLSVRANGWEVNTTRAPIYNHVAGPSRWRFDFVVRPLDGTTKLEAEYGTASKTCFPHGIIGQSWDGDDIAVSGATDDYTFGAASIFKVEMTTKAMAEGAIEGVASDYEVDPHTAGFKYSRFDESPESVCAPRNVAKLTGMHSPRAGVATAGSDDSAHEADATSTAAM